MTDVNLQTFPQALANQLGMPLFAGQLLATVLIVVGTILPITLLKKHEGWLAELIIGILDMAFAIAIGWLPYWTLILVTIGVVALFAGGVRNWITGKGGN